MLFRSPSTQRLTRLVLPWILSVETPHPRRAATMHSAFQRANNVSYLPLVPSSSLAPLTSPLAQQGSSHHRPPHPPRPHLPNNLCHSLHPRPCKPQDEPPERVSSGLELTTWLQLPESEELMRPRRVMGRSGHERRPRLREFAFAKFDVVAGAFRDVSVLSSSLTTSTQT